MLEKEFVPVKESLALKEIGFDEPCFAIYGKSEGDLFKIHTDKFDTVDELHFIKAPTFSQAFRWFREKHELFCWIEKFHVDETYIFQIPPANFTKIQGHYITYEEAELACLKKLIEIANGK